MKIKMGRPEKSYDSGMLQDWEFKLLPGIIFHLYQFSSLGKVWNKTSLISRMWQRRGFIHNLSI